MRHRSLTCLLVVLCLHCNDQKPATNEPPDVGESVDLATQDAARNDATLVADSSVPDAAVADLGPDMAPPAPDPCLNDDDCTGSAICVIETGRCVCDAAASTCVDEIAPGHWIEVADSQLRSVFPPSETVPGNPATVIAAWGGGVYDTDRDRLVLWGGGHADYSGNEVYVFDLNTLQWERLNEPSLDVGGDEASGYYPDGLPRSRHTYDYIAYVPPLGSMCSMGGSALYPSGQINVSSVDCFSFETLAWSRFADAPAGTIAGIADYDPVAQRVAYVVGPQLRYLAQWSAVPDTWTTHGDNFTNGGLGIRLTGRVDPVARRFVAVGQGAAYTWTIDEPGNFAEVPLATTNAPANYDRSNPGLTFDTDLGRIVHWGGGTSLWSLDLAGNVWEEHAAAPENTVSPSEPNSNGTYGRFRYAPNLGVYVLVNDAAENVFLFRLPAD